MIARHGCDKCRGGVAAHPAMNATGFGLDRTWDARLTRRNGDNGAHRRSLRRRKLGSRRGSRVSRCMRRSNNNAVTPVEQSPWFCHAFPVRTARLVFEDVDITRKSLWCSEYTRGYFLRAIARIKNARDLSSFRRRKYLTRNRHSDSGSPQDVSSVVVHATIFLLHHRC